jgi:hypothetical protein
LGDKKGTLHTALLLEENLESIERQHAIIILASLWNKETKLPEHWRGDGFQLVREAREIIQIKFPDLGGWHYASRDALPVNVGNSWYSRNMLVPKSIEDLMFISAIEAAITHANWQLIKYQNKS